MAGYVLTFCNDALTHIDNPIWKLKVTFTKHDDINGDEDEDIEIGYADVTIVDSRNFDVSEFTKNRGDFICKECTDFFLYYINNKHAKGVFPTKILTFIEKFYIYPEYRGEKHGRNLLNLLIESLSQLQYNEYIVLSPYPFSNSEYENKELEIDSPEYNLTKSNIENMYLKNNFELYRGIPEYEFEVVNRKIKNKVLDIMVYKIVPKYRSIEFYLKLSSIKFDFEPFAAYIYDDQLSDSGFSFS